MARQPTPDIFQDALAAGKAIQDDVRLIMGDSSATHVRRDGLQDVPVELIDDNPFQPRAEYTGIEELAADIAANGLLQVPKGRRMPDGRVQLQYGHRRLRAVIQLGWQTMPIEVQSVIDDRDMAVRAWSENHNRQDFTAIDQARYFRSLLDAGWTQKQIADRLNLSAPAISNTLRLLELPADLTAAIAEKQLSARQGEALVSLMTLPDSIRKRGEAHYQDRIRPSAIIRSAVAGGASSDEIRARTTELIKTFVPAVHDEPWYDVALTDDAGVIVSSTCKSCLATIKRDAGVFCTGGEECQRARANLWAQRRLEPVAEETGIPALGMMPTYGQYEAMDSYDTRDLFKELQARGGCPHGNLRLAYQKERWSKGPFDGHPNAFPICYHGSGHKCRCLVARQREQAKAGTANKTTESIGKKLVAEAAAVLAEALMTVPDGILRHVWAPMVDYTLESEETEGMSRDEFAMRMAVQILRRKVDNYNSIQANKERIETMLAIAGLRAPWLPPDAPQLRLRLQKVQTFLDEYLNEGDGLPTPAAIDGQMNELNAIFDAAKQLDEGDVLKRIYSRLWAQAIAVKARVDESYAKHPE